MGTEALEQLSGRQVIEAAARGDLTEAQVERLIERDPALARLAMIAAMQAIAQLRRTPGGLTLCSHNIAGDLTRGSTTTISRSSSPSSPTPPASW